jgi:serine/threonine-protein kinase RsbW
VSDASERLDAGDRIQLTFPARGDLIVLARLVTSAISARAGFDIEELEDLRLAVGELCLLALQGSEVHHGDLCVELMVLDDALGVSCTLQGAGASATAADVSPEAQEAAQLSEQILGALVDEHGLERQDGSLRAWLQKRRSGHAE